MRRLAEGQFGSNATNSCGVDGVSDDGRLLNVNSPGVIFGDGTLDRVSLVDGVELHSKNVLVESSLVDGSIVKSSLADGFSGEKSVVESSFVNDVLDVSSLGEGLSVVDNCNLNLVNDFDNLSVVSQNVSLCSDLSYEKSKGGRPKKPKRSGRPRKSTINRNSFVKEVNNNSSLQAFDIPVGPEFLSIDLLDVPFGPMPNIDNRIFTDDIVFSRPEINSLVRS